MNGGSLGYFLKFPFPATDNESVDDLTREFLLESQEGLDRMERCLTDLEVRPGDAELLGEIFRSVHTIKGTTGFLGFGRLEALSHAGESLLGQLRDGKLMVTPEIISGLLALMDRLRGILRSIEATGAEGESQRDDDAMIALMAALQTVNTAVVEAEPPVAEAEIAAVVAAPARRAAAKRPRPPKPGAPRAARRVAPLPEEGPVSAEEAGPRGIEDAGDERVRGGALPSVAAAESTPARSRDETSEPPAHGATADSTLRVDVDLLNRMMNLVGELVLTRNQILQATSADAGFALLGRRLDMVTADLRESVMKARMQPVSHVFSRFPRLVRDLALGLGKQVKLELEGQETELDKSLLEAIRDPLTHAIRDRKS